MKLQELIKKQTTVQHHTGVVEYMGEDIEFYTRPLLASDQEMLLAQIGDSLPAITKVQETLNKGGNVTDISGKDFVNLQTARRQYAACVLCDENGKKLFNSYDRMVKVMDSDAIDLIADYIDENVKDQPEKPADIVKK